MLPTNRVFREAEGEGYLLVWVWNGCVGDILPLKMVLFFFCKLSWHICLVWIFIPTVPDNSTKYELLLPCISKNNTNSLPQSLFRLFRKDNDLFLPCHQAQIVLEVILHIYQIKLFRKPELKYTAGKGNQKSLRLARRAYYELVHSK